MTEAEYLDRCAPPEINQVRALIAQAQALIAKAKWLCPDADAYAQDADGYLCSGDDVLRGAIRIEAEHCRERGL